jgi:hypothetical protein
MYPKQMNVLMIKPYTKITTYLPKRFTRIELVYYKTIYGAQFMVTFYLPCRSDGSYQT